MASTRTKFLRLRTFARGLVTTRPPQALEDGEAQEATNLDLSLGTIKRRAGYTKGQIYLTTIEDGGQFTYTDPSMSPVTSLFAHYPESGSRRLFLITGANLKSTTDGDLFETELNQFAPSEPVYAQYKTTQAKVYIASSYGGDQTSQKLKKWTGSATISEVSASPSSKYIQIFNDALWVAGNSAAPNVVSFSRIFPNQDTWPVLNTLTIPGEGVITGMARVLNSLVVFKESSIHRITGVQPDDSSLEDGDLALTSYEDLGGCIAPNTLDTTTNSAVYLSRNGIYAYDGLQTRELTEDIRPLFESLNPGQLRGAYGRFVEPNHYVLSVATEDSEYPNLIVSMRLQPTLSFTVWEGFTAYSWDSFQFEDGIRVPVFGGAGFVGRMNATTDDGTPIRWAYTTGILDLGNSPNAHIFRRGWVEAKVTGDSLEVEGLRDFEEEGVAHFVDLSKFKTHGESGLRARVGSFGSAHNWAVKVSGAGTGTAPEVTELLFELVEREKR